MNLAEYYLQKKIQGGDIREYEKLFVRYFEPLCHHAYKFLKDMELAEDIVQEFFYNFWKNRSSFSPKLSLNAYLYQCIRNNSLHYLEHLETRRKYVEIVESENKNEPYYDDLPGIQIEELNRMIGSTLNQLPERCSLVFRMNRFEGKKYREIAEMLSISIKTVEADMGKALQLFREVLKDYINVPS